MSLIPDFLFPLLWFILGGLLSGLIVYIYMLKSVKGAEREYKSLESQLKKTNHAIESLKKDTNLEIRARDRKLEIVDEKYLALQEEYKVFQKDVKTQIEEKNQLILKLKESESSEADEEK